MRKGVQETVFRMERSREQLLAVSFFARIGILELFGIGACVQRQIRQGEEDLTHGRIAGAERALADNRFNKRIRERFARLDMTGKRLQDCSFIRELLKELRSDFHRIPFNIVDARAGWRIHLCQHHLQCVSHFMEERGDFIKTHRSRLFAVRRLLVANHHGNRQHLARFKVAHTEFIHPRAAPFGAGTRIGIEVKSGNHLPFRVLYPIETHVFVPSFNVAFHPFKGHFKELMAKRKESFQHTFHREIIA